jgi:hypothetical protein
MRGNPILKNISPVLHLQCQTRREELLTHGLKATIHTDLEENAG